MKKVIFVVLLLVVSAGANAQQIIRGKNHLRVFDANTRDEIQSMGYREVCLGETPAILVVALGQNSLLHPLNVIPWPADKPNPCKGLAVQK